MASSDDPVAVALFGRTRRALLSILFGRPDEQFFVRQLVRLVGAGPGAVHRELKRLRAADLILRRENGAHVYYHANMDSPVFVEMESLMRKTSGVPERLRAALLPLRDKIGCAFIHGSFARGRQRAGSDVDLMIVGSVSFAQIVSAVRPVQDELRREINPSIYQVDEFRRKLATRNHFLCRVMRLPRIFLIGDDDELKAMAG